MKKINSLLILSTLILLIFFKYYNYKKKIYFINSPKKELFAPYYSEFVNEYKHLQMDGQAFVDYILNIDENMKDILDVLDIRIKSEDNGKSIILYDIGFDNRNDSLKNIIKINEINFISSFFMKGDVSIIELKKI